MGQEKTTQTPNTNKHEKNISNIISNIIQGKYQNIENQKTQPIGTNYLNYSDLIQGSKDSILLLCQFFSNQSKYNLILIKISVGILQNVSKIHMEMQSQLKERSHPRI